MGPECVDQVWFLIGQHNYDWLFAHSYGLSPQYFMNVGKPNKNAPFEVRMRLFFDEYSKYIVFHGQNHSCVPLPLGAPNSFTFRGPNNILIPKHHPNHITMCLVPTF